jgi:hypothetical protein
VKLAAVGIPVGRDARQISRLVNFDIDNLVIHAPFTDVPIGEEAVYRIMFVVEHLEYGFHPRIVSLLLQA